MILDTVNATSGRWEREAAQPGRYDSGDRWRLLPILSGLTFSTVTVLAALIVWASLT